jgi:hypothetical protein
LASVGERHKAELRREAAEHFARRRAEPKRIRWNQLTREERNAHRRKQYEARRAVEKSDPVLEAKRRESRRLEAQRRQQNNPESVREARRRWFHAHADEVNRKQRAYRQARAERSRSKSSESTAEQSAKNWLKHLERHGPGPSAEQSAKNWLASLESHGLGPTAEESARAWLSYLEREASADRSQSTPASADEHGRARSSDGVQPDNPSPDRDHDFGL